MTENITWGMIGCGDVTEKKSGPAFNKVAGSSLRAVMRRDATKAVDYAKRHHVPLWYNDADALLANENINAIYIATPPSSHYEYVMAAFDAGKSVYVEKPMALNAVQAKEMVVAAAKNNTLFCIAHYRRQQPKFLKVKELIRTNLIGNIEKISLEFSRVLVTEESLKVEKNKWRVDPQTSGGGLFHDIAPHQLDLLLYFFGVGKVGEHNIKTTQQLYNSPDQVNAIMHFAPNIIFSGNWNFNAKEGESKDLMTVTGDKGSISFTVFDDNYVYLNTAKENEKLEFESLQHAQEPMIAAVTNYFLGKAENPCSGEEGLVVMEWIDEIVS